MNTDENNTGINNLEGYVTKFIEDPSKSKYKKDNKNKELIILITMIKKI